MNREAKEGKPKPKTQATKPKERKEQSRGSMPSPRVSRKVQAQSATAESTFSQPHQPRLPTNQKPQEKRQRRNKPKKKDVHTKKSPKQSMSRRLVQPATMGSRSRGGGGGGGGIIIPSLRTRTIGMGRPGRLGSLCVSGPPSVPPMCFLCACVCVCLVPIGTVSLHANSLAFPLSIFPRKK